ncbi:MAG: phosphoribosyltransferase [Actinomycetota bacterium]
MWRDRREAGRYLAEALKEFKNKDVLVLAIPRGGVVVGDEVATALNAALDVVVPRKIGAPFNPELAIGAIAADGSKVLDQNLIQRLDVSEEYLKKEIERQTEEIKRRISEYRGGRSPLEIEEKTVILVDDGVATGATTLAAIKYLRNKKPAQIILAIPVGPPDTVEKLKKEVDRLICLSIPLLFYAVGQFYEQFEQTTDQEVVDIISVHKKTRL